VRTIHLAEVTLAASWLPEPLPVLAGGKERLNHLGLDEVSVELVELL
jgi:hypothetical protein